MPKHTQIQPRPGGLQMVSPVGLVVGSCMIAPAAVEFWVRFPNERNQGKQALPVLKYRVPHSGSQCVLQYEPGSADGCKTASSKKSENTQQSWFEKPEHGACS